MRTRPGILLALTAAIMLAGCSVPFLPTAKASPTPHKLPHLSATVPANLHLAVSGSLTGLITSGVSGRAKCIAGTIYTAKITPRFRSIDYELVLVVHGYHGAGRYTSVKSGSANLVLTFGPKGRAHALAQPGSSLTIAPNLRSGTLSAQLRAVWLSQPGPPMHLQGSWSLDCGSGK